MYANQDKYYSGQGEVLIGRVGTLGKPLGLRPIGNVPDLKISMAITNIEHKEARSGQRSIDKRLATETKVNVSFTLENFNKANLAMAMRGVANDVVAGSVTNEVSKFFSGMVMPLEHLGVSAVVVSKGATALVAYVDEVTDWDYKVNTAAGSIEFNTTADAATALLADGDALTIDYAYAAQTHIQALTTAQYDYFLRFEGLNTADENKSVVVEVFRFASDPLKELSLISDTIGQFALDGTAYPSAYRPAGDSPYFRELLAA